MENALLLTTAGFIAGSMNAIAGGGSFVTLPALIGVGVPSVAANASSTVALFPGSLASALGYRAEFRPFEGVRVGVLLAISLIGGILGALLLLVTPSSAFDAVLPWLMLVATLAFAFGRHAGAALRRVFSLGRGPLLATQFLIAIYGGYFGGAVGIMMMAAWSVFGIDDLRAMNAAKTLLVSATNSVAVLCFVAAGEVHWQPTLAMLAGAVVGGYAGARVGRRLDPARTRIGISLLNVVITAIFFWRAAH